MGLFFVLRKKKASAEYWPRLTKEKKKHPFIKTDFDKWVDEDEQDTVDDSENLAGGMGMGGGEGGFDFSQLAGGAGGPGGFDFSQLAGLGGGAGGADLSGLGEDELASLQAESGEADATEEVEEVTESK
ncbi:Sba1p [Sugiyamaella lignohabitans]|uniref:Sba1p n=1 Tax=Sugiyamaella lignohabitans TaxID=796027 RepID=A0A167EGL7_9ASCO|nr:Sba1p [Sugiyamaella lignohabitans]ANB14059.1 Sba1p [Sugiyamaella lignohabitans]